MEVTNDSQVMETQITMRNEKYEMPAVSGSIRQTFFTLKIIQCEGVSGLQTARFLKVIRYGQLSRNSCYNTLCRRGWHQKKNDELGLFSKVGGGGGVRGGFKGPTCYMVYSVGVKCAKKYSQTI